MFTLVLKYGVGWYFFPPCPLITLFYDRSWLGGVTRKPDVSPLSLRKGNDVRDGTRCFLIILVVLIFGIGIALGYDFGRASRPEPPAPLDARLVHVFIQNRLGVLDPSAGLVAAWERATGGRSRLVVVFDREEANAVIEVVPNDCLNGADSWQVNPRQRAIIICVASANVQRYGILVVVHEIAHIWCCDVGGYPDTHWDNDAEPGIMNGSLYGIERGLFSPRELRAMGLR